MKNRIMLIAEKNAAIMEKHSALEAVTMQLADMETLVDEVAGQAYEKPVKSLPIPSDSRHRKRT